VTSAASTLVDEVRAVNTVIFMTQNHSDSSSTTCPILHTSSPSKWWPEQLELSVLHRAHPAADPEAGFDYRASLSSLDLAAVKEDLADALTDSQPWWPADWGNYGGFFIRLAWHSAGTYRTFDGRGGAGQGLIRFAPLGSWPDNANLDKARRLLWPVKQKWGRAISWADLFVLAGNVALEQMGLKTHGLALGRVDVWEPDTTYWGNERAWLADERHDEEGELAQPLAAVQMGLIYVNPEGPNGNPDPLASARDIRETFARMGMDDAETVALIAGGHTFGKTHGAASAVHVGPEPEAAPVQQLGLGWKNSHGTGNGADTITSGLEGAWTQHPTRWDNEYFQNLFGYEWELTESPAGAKQWRPVGEIELVPDAHTAGVSHVPMMLTSDLALRFDPAYEAISRHFWEDHAAFEEAFAKAWYKLTHRDMGPHHLLIGAEVPASAELWQDPVPALDHELVSHDDVEGLKRRVLELAEERGVSTTQLVSAAWAAAATYRHTDKRGGTNGGRIRLAPQRSWAVNESHSLELVISLVEDVKDEFDAAKSSAGSAVRVSFADLLVIAGNAVVERCATRGGVDVAVPFSPGRTDATQELTDVESFAVLEPKFDALRNYVEPNESHPAERLMLERAALLGLSAPELAALLGGLRSLGVTSGPDFHGHRPGVFSETTDVLNTSFFSTLLDMSFEWEPADASESLFLGRVRETKAPAHVATRVDLAFGSNSQLRAIAESYAADDAAQRFVESFAAVWAKVMHAGY
jgi:catalase-peroxidase